MRTVSVILAMVAVLAVVAIAKPEFLKVFNETYKPKSGTALAKASCAACHTKMGSKDLNPYGKSLKEAMKGKAFSADTLKKVENVDSDKDGAKNITEIKAGTLPGEAKSKPDKKSAIADVDPVCNMRVDKSREPAGGKSTYEGVTYYFCNRACKEAFDKNPEKYVKGGNS